MERCVERAEAVCKSYPRLCHKCLSFREESNADRIRAMSDDELAEWIAIVQIGAVKEAMNLLRLPYDEPDGLVEIGKTEALEWLNQPADDLPKITDQTMDALEKMGEKAHGGE